MDIVILQDNYSITKAMENSIVLNQNNSEIILYQPDETIQLEVRMEEDTVWLTQQQMMELFQSSRTNIVEHIKHIYADKL